MNETLVICIYIRIVSHLKDGCDLEAPLEVPPGEVLHQDVAHARPAQQHRARGVQLVVRAVHLETI